MSLPTYALPTVSSSRRAPSKKFSGNRSPVSAQKARSVPRATIDRNYTVRKPPVPRRPNTDTKIIETLKNEQRISKQKYADSISEIKNEIANFKQETSQMVNAYQDLRLKLDVLAKANEEKEAIVVATREENTRIVNELTQMEQKVTQYEQVKIKQQEETERLEQELQNTQRKVSDEKEQNQKLVDRIRQLNIEIAEDKKLLASNDFDIGQIQKELAQKEKEIAQKDSEIERSKGLEQELSDLKQAHQLEADTTSSQLSTLKADNSAKQIKIDNLNSVVMSLDQEVQELNNAKQALQDQLKSNHEAAIAKQQELQSEKEDLSNKLESKTHQLKTKIETISQLEKTVSDSKEQYKQLQDQFAKKQEHYRNKISELKRSHELAIAGKDAEIRKLKSSPTKLGLSDDLNGNLFNERSSPWFNPNEIFNDSVVETKSPERSPNKNSGKSDKHKSRSATPKHTPTKNVLQPSSQYNSVPLSSGKIKKKSGSNKSSPLKSIKA
ncbi:hypothetical protein KGF57_002322 [Candida theae]|uniref:Uncharacterized protein n=1 Tax=Candida theae TaxID=1198502 RepID=A0AAD5BFN8_9ASCO|nr:uncharacterized protein KGF57_002322 [Candida theae]KAI5958888.1 hypothetical protein KGF57_002322 [Candida theae]